MYIYKAGILLVNIMSDSGEKTAGRKESYTIF